MKTFPFPNKKEFAFTIIDDTDYSFLDTIKLIYDFLFEKKIFVTKTVWVYPPRDKGSKGHSLQHDGYLNFVRDIKAKGFEIALHSIGSGNYFREDILQGLKEYKYFLREFPKIHINHAYNIDSIYGGYKRFSFPFNLLIKLLHTDYSNEFQGEEPTSLHFWGDVHKKIIKYNRSYEIDKLNIIKLNPYIPYIDSKRKEFSNYWFSAAFAPNPWVFNRLVTTKSINQLEEERGICILYTHLGYYVQRGEIDPGFQNMIDYISKKKGWFVPVSNVLDYLMDKRDDKLIIPKLFQLKLELLYLFTRFKYRKIFKIDDYTFKKYYEKV